jgi:hypothetical protein
VHLPASKRRTPGEKQEWLKGGRRARIMQACIEPPEYDAVQIRKKYLLRPLAVTSRTIQIVGLLGSFGFEVRHPPTRLHARTRAPLAT